MEKGVVTSLNLKTPKLNLGKEPALQMVTVNEVLNQLLNIVRSLELTKIVGVFDQALYGQRLLRSHGHILTRLRRPSSSGLEYSTPDAHC